PANRSANWSPREWISRPGRRLLMSNATSSGRGRCRLLLALVGALVSGASAQAQLPPTLPNPRLNWLFPAGGQVGTAFEVKVTGDDLDDAGKLDCSHPGITATLTMAEPGLGQTGPQPVHGTFQVKIAADVPPGVYELRVQGKFGLSNPRAFVVGTL